MLRYIVKAWTYCTPLDRINSFAQVETARCASPASPASIVTANRIMTLQPQPCFHHSLYTSTAKCTDRLSTLPGCISRHTLHRNAEQRTPRAPGIGSGYNLHVLHSAGIFFRQNSDGGLGQLVDELLVRVMAW